MENLEENLPPVKKLKQAKLSFKVTPDAKSAVKVKPQGQGKKRKNSASHDSPNKSSKPLITLGNSESPNAKSAKLRKLSFTRPNDDNDHEVSSSSEAESAVSAKMNNGKCCLMERFVRKLPQDCHQEISSTNEILSAAVDVESSILEEADKGCDLSKSKDVKKESNEPDCIIIDDENENADSNGEDENKLNESIKKVISDTEKKSCETNNDVSVEKQTQRKRKKPDTVTDSTASDLTKSSKKKGKKCKKVDPKQKKITPVKSKVEHKVPENVSASSTEVKQASDQETENDLNLSSASAGSLNESLLNSSSSSYNGSTPKKDNHDESDLLDTSVTPQSTPKTPSTVSASGKKERKVDTAKKAAREAERQKLKEEKEKARLEKKRKIEEEKAEKERIKMEKKMVKEKERQEQKEKLEKEKEEKEKAKEEERKKREEEKLKKEEEKKQKQAAIEAKQEEKRRKEEEKKQKEDEKLREEEEKKKKAEKTKQAFQSFFIKPKDNTVKPVNVKPSASGIFIPFEVKKDMHLAPAVRRDALSDDKKNVLDKIMSRDSTCHVSYLKQLKNGEVKPHKTGKVLRTNPQPPEDIEIVHDSEALKKVLHRVKLLQFHTDYRPPYYGTWRKSPALSARNPWKRDETLFDYEIDSDDEWEEEEPGESLSCSDGEEEKGEEAEDEDDDGWMVPHGYLSEDEGCNEDDEITPEKLKLQQQAKAKAWEEEQKRKFQAAPLIAVGCFFEHSPSSTMCGDVRLLYEFRGVVLLPSIPIPTTFNNQEPEKEEQVAEGTVTTPVLKGCQKKAVPEEAMPDLIRLVHGNTCGIKRLIREFRVFWLTKTSSTQPSQPQSPTQEDRLEGSFTEKNENISMLETSVNEANHTDMCENNETDIVKKKKEEGYGCSISKRQLELKISSMAVRERRQGFKKICWYVHENILSQFNLADLKLPNEWVFLSSGPSKSPTPNAKMLSTPKTDVQQTEQNDGENTEEKEKDTPIKGTLKDQRSIMDFALSKEELAKKIESQPEKSVDVSLSNPVGLVICQATPPEVKKPNNQRSIMDFAKKSGTKKKLCADKVVTKPSPSESAEVIDVNSDSSLPDSDISNKKDVTSHLLENLKEQKLSNISPISDSQGIAFINVTNCNISIVPNKLSACEMNEEMEEVESFVTPSHKENPVEAQSTDMDEQVTKAAVLHPSKATVLEEDGPEMMEIDSSISISHKEISHKDAEGTKAMEPDCIVIE